MAKRKRKTSGRSTASRRKNRTQDRMPAGLITLFAGLVLMALAFVPGSSAWRTMHDVLFGVFGCGSFVVGAALCYLAILYTRGEDLLPHIAKLMLGLIFASGTVIVFSDISADQTAAQMTPELAALCPECVYVPLELLAESLSVADAFRENGAEIVAALPSVAFGEKEESELRALLAKVHESGVTQALTGNLGLAMMAGQEGFRIRGDFDLAVMNSYTLSGMASAGFLSAMLSPELTFADIREMPKCMDAELAIYGRLPVMVTQTCLLKASAGRCTCTTPGQMADTRGGVWPVTKHFGCRNTVWAARKLWLGDVTQEWIDLGLWAVRLCFSTESARECLEVAESYIQGTHYKPNGITRGLYYRGVL